MKRVFLAFAAIIIITSCNKIPNKSIFEKLTTDELSTAFKQDNTFRDFYEFVREDLDEASDVVKATYNDITYRRFFNFFKFMMDSTNLAPKMQGWEAEWQNQYGVYLLKADSVLNYWQNYKAENSLDKYVKIELYEIDKEYYSYLGTLKNVNIGFRLTPLQGTVEQVVFTYGFNAKIHEGSEYYDKKRCRSTRPFSTPIVRYWKASYSDEDLLSGYNAETFLRDYNIYFEVTDIRIGGENLSIDNLNIPEVVSNCFDYENKYPSLYENEKNDLIKSLIYSDFVPINEYMEEKYVNSLKEKDEHCYNLIKEL